MPAERQQERQTCNSSNQGRVRGGERENDRGNERDMHPTQVTKEESGGGRERERERVTESVRVCVKERERDVDSG